jgi:murein DD-endopeptidase MepM/ murein hydrolase activator NlpD
VQAPPAAGLRRSLAVGSAAILAGAALLLTARATPAAGETAAPTQQERSLGALIAEQSEEIDAFQARIATSAAQVRRLESRLARARARLTDLREQLQDEREQLVLVRGQVVIARTRLSARLVQLYTSERPELIEVLLGAEDMSGVVEGIDTYSRLAEQNQAVAVEVERARVALVRAEARTERLETAQARQTASLNRTVTERRDALGSLVAARDRVIAVREARRRALSAMIVRREHWEAETRALASASADVAAIQGSTGAAPSAGGLIWPVRGSLISPFGTRWGRLHSGIDIAAPAGTPVVASASGTVSFAGSMGGYGLLVVVQHANGLSTAYAHNSSLAVGTGQLVAQGQMISAVGCTGSCTGDHLHFEVRVNGAAVDPMGYL